MSDDPRNDEMQPPVDSSTAGAFRSPALTGHKQEVSQKARELISQVGEAPLSIDADQVIRVGRTRVTLDTVISAFLEGATAEEIAEDYSSLNLADVYVVLGFYLGHKAVVDQYLEERRQLGDAIEKEIRGQQKNGSLREKLMDRMATKARANG